MVRELFLRLKICSQFSLWMGRMWMRLADMHKFSLVKNPTSPPQTPHNAFLSFIEYTTEANGLPCSSEITNGFCLNLSALKKPSYSTKESVDLCICKNLAVSVKKNHFTTLIFWSMEFTYISADVSLVGSSIPTDSSAQSMAAAPWDFHCNCSFRWRKTFEVLGTRKTYSRHLILSLGQQEKEAWMKDIKSTRSWG